MERVIAQRIYQQNLSSLKNELLNVYKQGARNYISWQRLVTSNEKLRPLWPKIQKVGQDSAHFSTLEKYHSNVLVPAVRRFVGGSKQSKLIGKKFHIDLQNQLNMAHTLTDVVKAVFMSTLGTKQKSARQSDPLLSLDACQFISRCFDVLDIVVEDMSKGWKTICDTIHVKVISEVATTSPSYIPGAKHVKRKPDCVIYAWVPKIDKRPILVWQCVVEIKTETRQRKSFNALTSLRTAYSQTAVICNGIDQGDPFRFTGKVATKRQFTCEKAIYQVVDSLGCVNNTLQFDSAKVNSKVSQRVHVYYDAYVWVGYRATNKKRQRAVISCSQRCFLGHKSNASLLNGPLKLSVTPKYSRGCSLLYATLQNELLRVVNKPPAPNHKK